MAYEAEHRKKKASEAATDATDTKVAPVTDSQAETVIKSTSDDNPHETTDKKAAVDFQKESAPNNVESVEPTPTSALKLNTEGKS